MRIVTKEELEIEGDKFAHHIEQGAVFIHPTDTIYGLGCNATDSEAIQKIRKMKQRTEQPFSILVPSKDWIKENCHVSKQAEKWIDKLPGPYTFILKLKNKDAVSSLVALGLESIGVRIPEHWFSNVVNDLGFPVITTSANVTGRDFMTSVDDLDLEIQCKLDFIVYEGEKKGQPSQLVDLTKETPEVIKR